MQQYKGNKGEKFNKKISYLLFFILYSVETFFHIFYLKNKKLIAQAQALKPTFRE